MKPLIRTCPCIVVCIALAVSSRSAHSATITLQDGLNGYLGTQDATIYSGSPTTNYPSLGTDQGRTVQESWGNTMTSPYSTTKDGNTSYTTALLKFDISDVPAGAIIQSATLSIKVTNTIEEAYLAVLTSAWDASTVTWNTFGAGGPGAGGGITVGVDTLADPLFLGSFFGTTTPNTTPMQQIDVTAAVQSWIDNPGTNQGWAFVRADTNKGAFVASKEANALYTSERPMLTISYIPEPTAALLLLVGVLSGLLIRRR
ncbi:MAG: DNRLRE domain-containing protein [Patescibacteria group bacterium]|nr:DNRLRE domain-containing protein [Patescibacteria group bacterium]